MTPEDAEEYTQSLGQILGGSWRQIHWAAQQGIPEVLGLSTEEWVATRLGGYTRLAVSERREAAAELSNEGLSQREIGEVLGVGKSTVDRDLKPALNGALELDQLEEPQVTKSPEHPPAPFGAGDPEPSEDEDWRFERKREEPTLTWKTGSLDHGIDYRLVEHYRTVQLISGCPCWIFIYEELSCWLIAQRLDVLGEPRVATSLGKRMGYWPRASFRELDRIDAHALSASEGRGV